MARRSVLLIVAVLIALVGTALIVLYVQGIDARATAGQELVEVLTATDVIETGEDVAAAQEAGKFEKTRGPPRRPRRRRAVVAPSSITDLVAIGTIYPGEQIIAKKFGNLGDAEQPGHPGRQAGRLGRAHRPRAGRRLRQPRLRGRDLRRRADPVALHAGRQGAEAAAVHPDLLLPKVQVVGVGTTSVAAKTTTTEEGEQMTEQVARTILTVAVDQEEAEKLIFAARNGDISFALLTERLQGRRQRRRPRRPTSCPSASGTRRDRDPRARRGAAGHHAGDAARLRPPSTSMDELEEHISTRARTSSPSCIGPSVAVEDAAELRPVGAHHTAPTSA